LPFDQCAAGNRSWRNLDEFGKCVSLFRYEASQYFAKLDMIDISAFVRD
jgi:hypothetical protein